MIVNGQNHIDTIPIIDSLCIKLAATSSHPHPYQYPLHPIEFNYTNVRNYMFRNLQYPPEAIRDNIQGIVLIRFSILATGNIDSIAVIESAHPLLDSEAIRLIRDMPRWKPVLFHGEPVPVTYKVPVIFELTDSIESK